MRSRCCAAKCDLGFTASVSLDVYCLSSVNVTQYCVRIQMLPTLQLIYAVASGPVCPEVARTRTYICMSCSLCRWSRHIMESHGCSSWPHLHVCTRISLVRDSAVILDDCRASGQMMHVSTQAQPCVDGIEARYILVVLLIWSSLDCSTH